MNRILQVIGRMDRGGAETLIMNLYRNIDRSKTQFDFLVHTQEKADYDEEIESLGGRIYRLPSFVGLNYFAYRAACKRHFKNHPEHKIVHGHIGSSAAIYLSEAKKANRFTIAHSHSRNFDTGINKIAFSIVSYPTRYIADYFIGCSKQAGLDRFGENVVCGKSFTVLKNGVNLEKYACNNQQHQESKMKLGYGNIPIFGHVGRFVEVKNHIFLIDVFKKTKELLPEAKLLLIGKGPLEDKIKEYSEKLGLSDDVRFLGLCSDVPAFLKNLDVFVFPSISEGLPVSVIEAQAAGVPAVLSTGVDEEACLLPSSKRLDLSEGATVWASELVSSYNEFNTKEEVGGIIRSKGFDIKSSAEQLIALYQGALNEMETK